MFMGINNSCGEGKLENVVPNNRYLSFSILARVKLGIVNQIFIYLKNAKDEVGWFDLKIIVWDH